MTLSQGVMVAPLTQCLLTFEHIEYSRVHSRVIIQCQGHQSQTCCSALSLAMHVQKHPIIPIDRGKLSASNGI